jgi:hypothetical protein
VRGVLSGMPDTEKLIIVRLLGRVQQKARAFGNGWEPSKGAAKGSGMDSDGYGRISRYEQRPYF